MTPDASGAPPQREQDAGLVGARRERGVRDGEGLAVAAEDDALLGERPRQAQAVHGNPRYELAAGALVGVRCGDRPDDGARLADELGGAHGRARRRVDLARVVGLDDLDRVEEGGGERANGGAEHAADREVRDEERPRRRRRDRGRTAQISAMRSLDQPEVPTTMGMPRAGGELDDGGARTRDA